MIKKIVQKMCILVLFIGLIYSPVMSAEATDLPANAPADVAQETQVNGELIGQTRGVYLKGGNSELKKIGVGKIEILTFTLASLAVNKIEMFIRVECWDATSDRWVAYDRIETEAYNTDFFTFTQTLEVKRGYYYRLRTDHSVYTERSSSYSTIEWIG